MQDDFVSSKKRSRVIGGVVSIGLLGVFAYFVFGYFLQAEHPGRGKGVIGQIALCEGTVQMTRDFDSIVCEPGMDVLAGDFFRIRGVGTVHIVYADDGTEVRLRGTEEFNTNIVCNGIEKGKQLTLGSGLAEVEAPDQPDQKPMVVSTSNAEATVLGGGRFQLQFLDLKTQLEVKSGKVRLRRLSDGATAEVAADESHTFAPAGPAKIEFDWGS
jgi:ferric-dicitrate binding protein FerR (iron transport regulator)